MGAGLTEGGARDGSATEAPAFIPGMDGNLYWNTTVPVGEKPILLYLYNGHEVEDRNAKFSEHVESAVFRDEKLAAAARRFVCEKICIGCKELVRPVQHRRILESYLEEIEKEQAEAAARVVLMDSKGEILREFKKPPAVGVLLTAMSQAEKENRRRLEEGARR